MGLVRGASGATLRGAAASRSLPRDRHCYGARRSARNSDAGSRMTCAALPSFTSRPTLPHWKLLSTLVPSGRSKSMCFADHHARRRSPSPAVNCRAIARSACRLLWAPARLRTQEGRITLCDLEGKENSSRTVTSPNVRSVRSQGVTASPRDLRSRSVISKPAVPQRDTRRSSCRTPAQPAGLQLCAHSFRRSVSHTRSA